ncbi:CASP-like protein 2C1 isoform X2 [Syzygium oleosum]|uniref:CASP-like protein 2C1 isoform X2 n=1 Tax=Syzygium oleosum TaxID=219896 RepID=UPI0024B9A716|nr:CASP-like protein 2C1 isoform X2 [Syzygium oleosum]
MKGWSWVSLERTKSSRTSLASKEKKKTIMGYWAAKTEALLRVCAILLLVLTACLVAMDAQTKLIVYTYAKKATFRDLNALPVLVYIDGVVAGYNLLQLSRCSVSACYKREIQSPLLKNLSWVHFLLDQLLLGINDDWLAVIIDRHNCFVLLFGPHNGIGCRLHCICYHRGLDTGVASGGDRV